MSNFIAVVKYEKIQENGSIKRVSEQYLCEALSVTEAEAVVTENVRPYISGDFLTTAIKTSKISEVMGDKGCGHFWLAKVAYIVIDEKTAKEKRTIVQWLIGAETFPEAYYIAIEEIKKGIEDAIITSISESPVIDTFLTK